MKLYDIAADFTDYFDELEEEFEETKIATGSVWYDIVNDCIEEDLVIILDGENTCIFDLDIDKKYEYKGTSQTSMSYYSTEICDLRHNLFRFESVEVDI